MSSQQAGCGAQAAKVQWTVVKMDIAFLVSPMGQLRVKNAWKQTEHKYHRWLRVTNDWGTFVRGWLGDPKCARLYLSKLKPSSNSQFSLFNVPS